MEKRLQRGLRAPTSDDVEATLEADVLAPLDDCIPLPVFSFDVIATVRVLHTILRLKIRDLLFVLDDSAPLPLGIRGQNHVDQLSKSR